MVNKQANPKLPLTDKDIDALEELFQKLESEDIKQIETSKNRYSASHIPAMEEKGWVANSFIPKR
jgi:hypothetical protein